MRNYTNPKGLSDKANASIFFEVVTPDGFVSNPIQILTDAEYRSTGQPIEVSTMAGLTENIDEVFLKMPERLQTMADYFGACAAHTTSWVVSDQVVTRVSLYSHRVDLNQG